MTRGAGLVDKMSRGSRYKAQRRPILPGLSIRGDLGEKVSLSWLTSPYFELREKFKCIEHIGKSKNKTSP